MVEAQKAIVAVMEEIKLMLLDKNARYGNSALEPMRIFAKSDAREQIFVRIDDKLNRIKNRKDDETEDVVNDLIGYLVLLKVQERLNEAT